MSKVCTKRASRRVLEERHEVTPCIFVNIEENITRKCKSCPHRAYGCMGIFEDTEGICDDVEFHKDGDILPETGCSGCTEIAYWDNECVPVSSLSSVEIWDLIRDGWNITDEMDSEGGSYWRALTLCHGIDGTDLIAMGKRLVQLGR